MTLMTSIEREEKCKLLIAEVLKTASDRGYWGLKADPNEVEDLWSDILTVLGIEEEEEDGTCSRQ